MPSDEERREVAARLREVVGLHAFAEIFGFSWTDESDWYWRDVTAKVADYVEPEPERTCRNISDPPEGFLCSECKWGDFCEPSHLLTSACFKGGGILNYCPNCGAKVVGE